MTNEHSLNKDALVAARKRVMLPHNLAPATVTYSTYGHLLIMGSEDMIRLAAEQLSGMASITLLATDSVESQNEEHLEKALNAAQEITVYHSKLQTIKGFLGQFQVTTEQKRSIRKLC